MKRILANALLGTLLAAVTASATPFAPARVPAGALWVIHADLDSLRASAPGRALSEHLATGKAGQQMDALAAVVGIDLRSDMTGLTLYGTSPAERDNVAVLQGRLDAQRIEVLLKANAGYKAEAYQGLTLHSWIDDKKKERQFGAIVGDLAVVSGSRATAQRAIDVLQARAASLAAQNPNQLPLPAAGTAFLLAAANLSQVQMTNAAPKARTLQLARAGSLVFSEQAGQVIGRLLLQSDQEPNARLIADAGRGLLALAQLDRQNDVQALELLQAIRVDQAGPEVSLNLAMPAEKVAVWLRTELQKDAKKKEAEAAKVE